MTDIVVDTFHLTQPSNALRFCSAVQNDTRVGWHLKILPDCMNSRLSAETNGNISPGSSTIKILLCLAEFCFIPFSTSLNNLFSIQIFSPTMHKGFFDLMHDLCKAPPVAQADLTGKTVMVVGANTGLGYEATKHFSTMNPARLILACRSRERGQAAVESTTLSLILIYRVLS